MATSTRTGCALVLRTHVAAFALATVAAATVQAAPQVGTIFEIAMENHNWTQPVPSSSPQQIKGNIAAPFINSLITPGNPNAAQTSYASNYLAAGLGEHPSEPNYIWAEAGTNYNKDTNTTIHTDADPSVAAKNIFTNTPHLTGQMNAAGVSWKNYQEDYQILNSTTPTGGDILKSKSGTSTTVTNPYYNTNQYNYAVKHNPMAFFPDTSTQNVGSFDTLRADIASDTVSVSNPTATNNFGKYNWITPNQFNDMHSSISGTFHYNGIDFTGDQSAIATGDNFLSIIVPQIMATDAYKNNGAIIIWMDETEGSGADDANHTLMEIVISPLSKGNAYVSTVEMNHSSDIKTMEEIFGLAGSLTNPLDPAQVYAGTPGGNTVLNANDLSDLFVAGSIPALVPEPTTLAVLTAGALALVSRRR